MRHPHPAGCQRPALLLSGLHRMPSGRCHTKQVDVLAGEQYEGQAIPQPATWRRGGVRAGVGPQAACVPAPMALPAPMAPSGRLHPKAPTHTAGVL